MATPEHNLGAQIKASNRAQARAPANSKIARCQQIIDPSQRALMRQIDHRPSIVYELHHRSFLVPRFGQSLFQTCMILIDFEDRRDLGTFRPIVRDKPCTARSQCAVNRRRRLTCQVSDGVLFVLNRTGGRHAIVSGFQLSRRQADCEFVWF